MAAQRTRTLSWYLGPLFVAASVTAGCTGAGGADAGAPSPATEPAAAAQTTAALPSSTTVTSSPDGEAPTSSTNTGASVTTTPPETTTTSPNLGPAANGPRVEALQRRLSELGYRVGSADGRYGGSTSSAVMAFQKVEGLSADGVAGPETLARLDAPQGAVPSGGSLRVEIDLARQVLFVVSEAGTKIFNTSTGNGETFEWPDGTPGLAYTPTGSFAVYYQVDGVDEGALGAMYRPLYFHTDWAIHGSNYVPAYPASHGCARVSNADQDWIWDNVPMGTSVVVY